MNTAIQHVLSKPLNTGSNSPELAFAVVRVPFFLEPDYNESTPFIESNRDRLVQKWGGKRGWEQQKNRHDLKGRGLAAGIPHFNLDRLASNSMASHRLIQHVGKRYGLNVSETLYDRLNVYYFVEGHALNDKPRLAKVAAATISEVLAKDNPTKQTAMNDKEILKFLNGNEGRMEIKNALRALQQMGVHGIPKFIIEGSYMVDGAAGPDTFIQIFRDIERKGKIEAGPVFQDILGVSDDLVNRGSHTRESLLLK